MGIRGYGASAAEAFEQAALALTAVVTELAGVAARGKIPIECEAVVDAADAAGLTRKVARVEPLICVKG